MARTLQRQTRFPNVLARIEQELSWRSDPLPWIEANLHIRTKQRQVIPLQLNPIQRDLYRKRTGRDLLLKARQVGATTINAALLFADTVLRPHTTSVIVAHEQEATELIFQKVHLFWQRLPEEEKRRIGRPHVSNRQELYWADLDSRCYVETAGSVNAGRGQTINNLLCSEYAHWPHPEEALLSLLEAVPSEGRIVIESTPNGMGHPFHDRWVQAKAGESSYTGHFYPWWWEEQYRLEGPPLGELTEDEGALAEAHRLTKAQLRWRREKRRELRDLFAQEYPEDDVTCFLTSGRCVFDVQALATIQRRIAGEDAPLEATHMVGRDGRELPLAPASLLIFQEPQPGRKYYIGADIAEGLAGGDASAAFVLDAQSGEQVAELQGRVPPERFAFLLDSLGRWYHKAELAVERNNHGHSTLNTLQNACQYPRLYRHTDYDQQHGGGGQLGWPTDLKTKPLMIDGLAAAVAEGAITLHSSALIDECLSYVVTDRGATEAQPGKHDDRVVAAAIAWQLRQRPRLAIRIWRVGMP
jgi:hypothetical protein